MPTTVSPAAAPKKGSAREEMFGKLRKLAEPKETPPEQPRQQQNDPNQNQPATDPKAKPGDTPAPSEAEIEAEEKAAIASGDQKRMGPWKLVQQYKKRAHQLESEIGELRKTGGAPADTKAIEERAQKAEQRAAELEKHIAFVDYRKSEEFQKKYQQPYEDSWKAAMAELGQLQVMDPDAGEARNVTIDDMLELVNAPLAKAKEVARSKFGDFAEEAMVHRREIKNLFDAQNRALEEAEKNAVEFSKKNQTERTEQMKKLAGFVHEHWTKFNDEAPKDATYGQYFRPVEGDEEGNKRLQKGFQLADRAFSVNSLDPRLTPEQRAEAVKVHAIVRNRSAAFGRAIHWLQKERETTAALRKELEAYKGSSPPSGDTARPPGSGQNSPGSAKDEIFSALRKLAR